MMHFVTKAPPISNIDSKSHIKKLKSSRTCLIGYISCEWLLIAWGHTHTHTHIDFVDENNFKKPGMHRQKLGLKITSETHKHIRMQLTLYIYVRTYVKIVGSVICILLYIAHRELF